MPRVSARVEVGEPTLEVEELWYDLERWPAFVDGFGHVAKLEGEWPQTGTRLVWDSLPRGRGRVVERVLEQAAGAGQTCEVEDPRLRGTQRVGFQSDDDGTVIVLQLDYTLKERSPLTPVVDLLFIRRALRDSLRRTLVRFARELRADRELLR